MSKFIIIGNEFSRYIDVEKILHDHGVDYASPSKREGLSPEEITALLQKVPYKILTESVSGVKRLIPAKVGGQGMKQRRKKNRPSQQMLTVQVENAEEAGVVINPVWNGLYLDLMLANLDKKLLGWSDPEAMKVIDYWAEVDPEIKFIFVYDHPQEVLLAELGSGGHDDTSLQEQLNK